MGMIKRSPWIYHLDCGSCLPPEEEIILGNGEIIKIGDLVNSKKKRSEVLSFSDFSPKLGKISNKFKIKSPKKLVEISISSGISVKLTKDHKVLIDSKNGPEWKEAKDIKVGDYVYCPSKIDIKGVEISIFDCLPNNLSVRLNNNLKKAIKRKLIEKYGNLKNSSKKLGINYQRLSASSKYLKVKEIRKIFKDTGLDFRNKIKEFACAGGKYVLSCAKIDTKIMYLLGLISSDGYIHIAKRGKGKTYAVTFDNSEISLIEKFANIYKKIFPNRKFNIRKQGSIYRFRTYNIILAHIANFFGIKGIRKRNDFKKIFQLSEELIASFLAGYFDGDGCVIISKDNDRNLPKIFISFATKEEIVAKRIYLLLKRIGVVSKITRTMNVRIGDRDNIIKFAKLVKSQHPRRKKLLRKSIKELLPRNGISSLTKAPLICGKLLKELRSKLKIYQKNLGVDLSLVSKIENLSFRTSKQTIKKIFKKLNALDEVKKFVSDDFYLDKVVNIKEIDAKDSWVYNIEVEKFHCFIPSGAFVVKNCNGCTMEILAALSPLFDFERWGCLKKGSPRHADIILVTGVLTKRARDAFLRVVSQIPEKKYVIAIGSCPLSGVVFRGGRSIEGNIGKKIKIDYFVPGCPPRPSAIIKAIKEVLKRK